MFLNRQNNEPFTMVHKWYKKIKLKNGRTEDEHRLLMEQHLHRKLRTNEIVHHINENKFDNRMSNLEVINLKDHVSFHRAEQARHHHMMINNFLRKRRI